MLSPLTTTEIQGLLLIDKYGTDWIKKLYPEVWEALIKRGFVNIGSLEGLTSGARYLLDFWHSQGITFQHEIVQVLGAGSAGAAFLLADESVLKITKDSLEKQCVMRILQWAWKNPHLPEIYDAGEIGFWFFYIREPLNDIPWDEDEITFEEMTISIERELYKDFGIELDDSLSHNWGIRPTDSRNPRDPRTWVVRDVSCNLTQ